MSVIILKIRDVNSYFEFECKNCLSIENKKTGKILIFILTSEEKMIKTGKILIV